MQITVTPETDLDLSALFGGPFLFFLAPLGKNI